MISKAFSAASVDVADHLDLGSVAATDPSGDHVLRVFATTEDSTGSATIEAAFVHRVGGADLVVARFIGTATATARRVVTTGASGAYVCDVLWAESGTSKLDLMGSFDRKDQSRGFWKLGVIAFSTINDITLYAGMNSEV